MMIHSLCTLGLRRAWTAWMSLILPLGLWLALPSAASAIERPNIIIILVDDLGWTDLGCFGSRYYETPNIDRMAAQGMRFDNAYAACAVCSPTRAALLTGRYPARIGITDWIRARFQGGKIPADKKAPTEYVGGPKQKLLCPPNPFWMEHSEVTIAERLKTAGYVTCHIGKWHLGTDDWYPETQGFDYNIGGCDFGQPPSYFDPYCRKGQGCIPTLKPRKEGEFLTDREADEAVQFIRKHRDRPFFLYLAHYAVHTPLMGKKEVVAKYQAKPKTNQKNPTYAAMVESVDDACGRVLQVLDELHLARKTLIIFTSDNGGLLGPTDNAPLRSGKGFPYEGGIRVPLIARWPYQIAPGTSNATPVCSIDIMPTVLEAAGVDLPKDRVIDGVSFFKLLTGREQTLPPRPLYWHFPHYRGRLGPYSIIRDGDWKLIYSYVDERLELYNLAQDLSERTNLASSEPVRTQELKAKLDAWLKQVGAKLPRPNPAFKPGG